MKHPGYAWNVDLTLMPTRAGFWVPWLPSALTQRWPFCWWIAVILDHFSRRVIGFAVFKKQPTSEEICSVFDRAVSRAGYAPKCTISDHGVQFGAAFREWCERHGVQPRFGAIGRYGSIAVIERFMRTLKSEGLRRVLVPLRLDHDVRLDGALHRLVQRMSATSGAQRGDSLRGLQPCRSGESAAASRASGSLPRRVCVCGPSRACRTPGRRSDDRRPLHSRGRRIFRSLSFATLLDPSSILLRKQGRLAS